jgi:hypothetical protein
MAAHESLHPDQFVLYRGEGSHDRPSYYPPGSGEAGGWWTTNRGSAERYAKGQKGQVYQVAVHASEAKQQGLPSYYYISDPKVRERRVAVGGQD